MEPKITVIIPAYNTANYISASIGSVIAQSLPDWELIVVNDGSTDNTASITESYLSDKRIKLINQQNKGVSAARNAGIIAANGKYLSFLDADDCYLPDNLRKKYDLLEKDASVDFVYSDVIHCNENLDNIRVEKAAEADNLFTKVLLWKEETIPGLPSNIMIKAELMKKQFLFDEHLSNCADRYMKILLSKNARGAYIPQALVKYRNSPGSMSKNVKLLEHDEKYIIRRLKETNMVPPGTFRRKIIANIYLILAGSWHKDAHKPLRAIFYGLKAIFTYPPFILKLFSKTGKQLLP